MPKIDVGRFDWHELLQAAERRAAWLPELKRTPLWVRSLPMRLCRSGRTRRCPCHL